MKGREALEKWLFSLVDDLTGYAPPEKDAHIKSCVDGLLEDGILRDLGYVSLDDVVEGQTVKEVIGECPDIQECEKGNTFRCPTGWVSSQCRKHKESPATIRDILGRDK
jgi:hypothetical protein